LLCWSVIGWPSTENEFSAWSPMPWNIPFESAVTPGDARVTSELTEEDALSSGSLSIKPRSIFVCMVESFSTRSSTPVTTTVFVAAPSARAMFAVTGQLKQLLLLAMHC